MNTSEPVDPQMSKLYVYIYVNNIYREHIKFVTESPGEAILRFTGCHGMKYNIYASPPVLIINVPGMYAVEQLHQQLDAIPAAQRRA